MNTDRVVLHPVHGPGLAEALATLPNVDVVRTESSDDVVAALDDGAGILLTYHWEDRFITGGLRWLQAISAGMDQFPMDALREAGVVVTSARGAHAPAVAEHAIALLLSLVRNIGTAVRDVRGWDPRRRSFEVRGRTLGILGLGAIGEEVGRLGAALGMRVIGTKRSPDGYDGIAEEVFSPEDTLTVCERADAVVIALPRADVPAIGPAELEALRDGWLINVGRGSAVDETALVAALADGTLRGAGLDVFEVEPLPADSPLWDLPTAVITPHAAWSTDHLAERIAELFARNLMAHRGEGPWLNRLV